MARKSSGLMTVLLINIFRLTYCQGAPTITQDPVNQTVQPGETVTLQCTVADKTSDYLVAWIADEQRITRTNNESLDSQHVDTSRFSLIGNWANGDYTLEIQRVNSRDAAIYTCLIFNEQNIEVARSNSATIAVEFPPDPSQLQCFPKSSDYLRVGATQVIGCQSEKGNPMATLELSLDSLPVDDVTLDDSLSFTTLQYTKMIDVDDNGKTYRCDLTHKLLTEPEYCEITLGVVYEPMDVQIDASVPTVSGNVEVNVGDGFYLTCDATGNPAANYSWTITEAPGCSKGPDLVVVDGALHIINTPMVYNGANITCIAKNAIGESSVSIALTVHSDNPNDLCYTTTTDPPTRVTSTLPVEKPTIAPSTDSDSSLTTLHIIIIVIAAAFLIVIIILGYMAFNKRPRDPPIQVLQVTADDARSLSEGSLIFQSRHNTPDPELRGNSLSRLQSNFSTLSYDTQSIDSATALMHLKSLDSPEYRANPKLTGSPTRKFKSAKEMRMDEFDNYKLKSGKEISMDEFDNNKLKSGKEMSMEEFDNSPFHRIHASENTYEGSPKRTPPTSTPKSTLTRQPSEHKYEECPPLKKYATHASQTDLTVIADVNEDEFPDTSDSDDEDLRYNPTKQNFSVNNCNSRYGRHTEV